MNMKSLSKYTSILSLAALLLVAFQNCSPMEGDTANDSTSTPQGTGTYTPYINMFDKVIVPKCLSCHGSNFPQGEIDLSSYSAIMAQQLVIPGNSQESRLYQLVASGAEPPITPLSANEIADIAFWIDDGAKDAFGVQHNSLPVVNTGPDIYIYLNQTFAQFDASATDYDGSISLIQWRQLSGPKNVNIVDTGNLKSEVTEISIVGTYQFELNVTDNDGASTRKRLNIHLSELSNYIPSVNAGLDINIQVPKSTATINASAGDSDGSITSLNWTQLSGPNTPTMSGQNSSSLSLSNLVLGTYEFRISVTDNEGAKASDTVKVIVDPAPVTRSFKDINDTIFKPKCLSCHQGANARGGYPMENYSQIMTLVDVNNANNSELFIRCHDLTMPPGRPLSKVERDKIRDWINTGAPNN